MKNCRRIISFCLTLALLLSLLPAVQLFPAMEVSAASAQTITVYFKNTYAWDKVCGYVWDSNGARLLGDWPGKALSADSTGLYKLSFDITPVSGANINFIFNNGNGGDGNQTGDLYLSYSQQISGDTYWVNGPGAVPAKYALPTVSNGKVTFSYQSSSASTVKLAGTMNSWSGVSMTKSGSTFSYTYSLEPGTYEYKFIKDGSWINDPWNPLTKGDDNNNYVIVPGIKGASISAVRGGTTALPTELACISSSGSEMLAAVTYSTATTGATLSGNQLTIGEDFSADTLELTATTADGLTGKLTVNVTDTVQTGNSVKVHFHNSLGWDSVCAYAWTVSGWSWPGKALNRDADGYYTLELNDLVLAGDLGVLFHNNNGEQTGDITIAASEISAGDVELWVSPSTTAGEDGKFACSTASSESGVFITPEINGTQVTFRYKNSSASSVYLAGSFNNWSTSATKLTKGSNGLFSVTLDLSVGVHEYKLIVDGEWMHDPNNLATGGYDGNSIVVVPASGVTDTGKITVHLHFYRESGEYDGWDVWFWDNSSSGSGSFVDEANGRGKVASFTADGRTTTKVGYVVRKTDWSDKEFYDRFIDVSDIVSGTVHFYLVSGVATGTRVLGPDVVTAPKINYANFDYDSGKVWVKTSVPVEGALSTAFTIVDSNGNATDISVSGVTVDNGGYSLTLSRSLVLGEVKSYRVKYEGCDVQINTDGLLYSEKFRSDYNYTGDDLGATWSETSTTFKVWAPTANHVQVVRYKGGNYADQDWIETVDMTLGEKGVWSATVSGDLHGTYYNYLVHFDGYTTEATDPYANSTGANGDRGMVLNMDSTDPEGWENDVSPNKNMSYTDAIIYEMHVREFTIDSSSGVKDAWRGKYLGLTQSGTNYNGYATGLEHLKELGVTHVQLMPVYDYSSVDEYHLTDWQQYAWGYDPKNYNVPEGSYSTDPFDGSVRVTEFKQMVQSFHSNGINVVMDVVFNHAFDGGNFCYNKIVPNYFSRFWGEGNWSNGSGVGNDMATEREMARNFIVDSIMHWVEEYHIDGFRFDLAGLIDTQTINEVVNTVRAKYPNVLFYGEGWAVGGTAVEEGFSLTTKDNAWAVPGFGFFNDNFRNDIAGNNGGSWGFATGDSGKADAIANYFRASNGWSYTPTQTINYVSCHDNYSLMDKIIISKDGTAWLDMVKMNNLSAAIYMMAQGTPFMYSGEELLREKKDADGNRYDNAYGTDDYINKIRWSDLQDKTYAQMADDYYAGLIEFRKNHAALRCPDGADAWNYTSYHKINDHCVMFYINGYPNWECSDGIVIIFNANSGTQWVDLYNYGIPSGYWQACVHGTQAGTDALWGMDVTSSSGSVGVEGLSTTILVLGDLVHEESVYNQNLELVQCNHTSHNTSGVCTNCGATVGHSYTSKVTAPTCNDAGYTTYTCGKCSHSYTGDTVAALGHTEETVAGKAPTCTETGLTDGVVCTVCGEIVTAQEVIPVAGHSYVDGVCTVCGGADPDYVKPVVVPALGLVGPTLNFEDEIYYNIYFTASDLTDVVEMGLVIFNERLADGTINDAEEVIPGYTKSGDNYMSHTNGIPAKMLGDALFFRVYAKLSDGSYVYSQVAGYHAVAYAKDILANSTSEKMKALVVAMLNYGAAAQTHFEYKTDNLMNAFLTDAQQALVSEYSADMAGGLVSVDSNKVGSFNRISNSYTALAPNVSFEGAFSINYYFTPAKEMDGEMKLYYWTLEDYNAVDVLTTENATGVIVMEETATAGQYFGAVSGIAAKQIDETIFACGVYECNGVSYPTGILTYSLAAYCQDRIAKGTATMQEFAKATVVYGYYAKAYFA